jgi:hypothetical protein
MDVDAIARAFVAYQHGSVDGLRALISDDCLDHVSGRSGWEIWETVASWLEDSFSDTHVDLNGVGRTDDSRVMIWITTHATHVGSAFPWMRGRAASGRRVAWSQLHVFRVDDRRLVEHWAVRDDLRVLEAIDDN